MSHTRLATIAAVVVAVMAVLTFLYTFGFLPFGSEGNLATESWNALNQAKRTGDYASTVKASSDCIARLQERATRIEEDLKKAGEPVVDPSEVKSEAERDKVHKRGPLNDIGACLFVKVAAEVAIGDTTAAQRSYAMFCLYPHALVWDPKGPWFWSPAEGARGELKTLGITPAPCQ